MDPPPPASDAEAVLTAAVAGVVSPVLIAGHDGAIVVANATAAAALGWTAPEELAGRPAPDGSSLLSAAREGRTVACDLVLLSRHDGSFLRAATFAVPIELDGGRGAVIAFTGALEADDDAARVNAPPRLASLCRAAAGIAEDLAGARALSTAAREIAGSVGLPLLHIVRCEPDDTITVVAAWSADGRGLPPGSRRAAADLPGGGERAFGMRVDDLAGASGPLAEELRAAGIGAVIGTPVVVNDRVWGLLLGGQHAGATLPADIEQRLAPYAALVASRVRSMARTGELARLADEQAALRRVATLVASGAPAGELLATVTREIGLLLDLDFLFLARYEEDGSAVGVGTWARHGNPIPTGTVTPDEGHSIPSIVRRTGRQVRFSDYEGVARPVAERLRALGTHTAVGVPVRVDGRLWGVLGVAAVDERRLPDDIGDRIAAFFELLATAIGDLEAREARERLTQEHEALRHIATLVARDVAPDKLFVEVAAAIGRLLDADFAALTPFVDDETWAVAAWSPRGDHPPFDRRFPIEPDTLAYAIRATRRPARIDMYDDATGELTRFLRDVLGARSAVGAPIVVGGRVWGALIVHTTGERRLPNDTTVRLESFCD